MNESGNIAAARTVQEAREEWQAKEVVTAREKEEAKIREAALLANEEAARKHRQEEEAAMATGGLSLAATNITVQSDGVALVRLNCLGIANCHGKLTLSAKIASKVKGKKKSARTGSIGTASFSIPPGKAATIELELNSIGRALLSADHVRVSASLTIPKSSPSLSQTHIENVQLVQQKAHGHAKK